MDALTRDRAALPLLAVVILAAFGASLGNGFAYDDFSVLVNNPAVTQGASPARVLTDPSTHATGDRTLSYRPLRTFLLRAEYRFFGESAAPYHAVNLLLHFLVCVLARGLARRVVGEPWATLGVLLWAGHPLLVEVVANVKAQDDLLAAVAMLAACLRYRGGGVRAAVEVGALALVGLLAKENVVVLPLVLVAVGRAAKPRVRAWGPVVAAAAVTAGFLVLRSGGAPFTGLLPTVIENVPRYWRLFVWPDPLTADYSHLPRASWASAGWWVSLAVQAAAVFALWRTGDRRVQAGLAWFWLTWLPHVAPLSYFVFAERFAYLPALGMAMVVVAGIAWVAQVIRPRPVDLAAAVLSLGVVVPLAVRSAHRCGDWRSTESVLQAALDVHPDSPIVRGMLASELVARGKTAMAKELLGEGAAALRPPESARDRRALSDLALIAMQEEEWERAAGILKTICESPFATVGDQVNRGTALTNLGEHEAAQHALLEALSREPRLAAAERMLGRIALEAENWKEASRRFERARDLEPADARGQFFALWALWKAVGDEAAIERLREMEAAEVEAGSWIRGADWEGAGPELRAALASVGGE